MTDPRPNWQWHNILDDRHHTLDLLRHEDPILWALCVGHRTSLTIANSLAMPLDVVRYELRRYKKEGIVTDAQAANSVVWRLEREDYLELRTFIRNLQKKNRGLDDSAEGP